VNARPVARPVCWPYAGWAAVALAAGLGGCRSERYARPPGPAPRYEVAPLAPWHDATRSAEPGGGALEGEIDRALSVDAGQGPEHPDQKQPEDQ